MDPATADIKIVSNIDPKIAYDPQRDYI